MTITCDSFYHFMEVITDLVGRGLGFKADASSYTITLTGAF